FVRILFGHGRLRHGGGGCPSAQTPRVRGIASSPWPNGEGWLLGNWWSGVPILLGPDNFWQEVDKISPGMLVDWHVPEENPLLWTRGVAARETLSYLDRRGIDAEPALSGAGISRHQLLQDDIGLSAASQYRFLELAATEANDQLLGLHVAAEVDIRAVGLLFYLTGASRTVSEALDNLARYGRTTNEALVAEISRQADEVILAIRRVEEFEEPHRQFFELLALWFIRTLHKETNRDFTLSRVTFTHARNADLREVHRLLRCPVDFAQGADSWILPQRVMDLPIVSKDSQLLKILTAHAEDLLAERHSVTGLQSMVANQLASLLPRGESRAAVVARELGMSPRSFTRHLAEEGTTFGEILERLRQRLAARYLADDRMSVQQIA